MNAVEWIPISNSSNPGKIHDLHSVCSVHAGLPNSTSSRRSRAGLLLLLALLVQSTVYYGQEANEQQEEEAKVDS
jgi:hypothetical protein